MNENKQKEAGIGLFFKKKLRTLESRLHFATITESSNFHTQLTSECHQNILVLLNALGSTSRHT